MIPQPIKPRIPDAVIDSLIASVQGNPVAMANCARTLLVEADQGERARTLCEQALALLSENDPHYPEVRALTYSILSSGIGSWYFTMVLDHPRHAMYEKALRRLLEGKGGVVLDIGAGTGLFAMLAVRAGATHVYACESDPVVAKAASAIIERNGMADRITVLPIDSRQMQIGKHMPDPADMLLWDNLANNFLGAGCVSTVNDAKARLLKPDAPILPSRAELMAAAVTDNEAEIRIMDKAAGFDLTPFNILRGSDFTLSPHRMTLRSEAVALFNIDVSTKEPVRSERASAEITLSAGEVHGIAQWIRFHLGDDLVYDTMDESVTAFAPQFHTIDAFDAAEGAKVRLHGAHDTMSSWFWIER